MTAGPAIRLLSAFALVGCANVIGLDDDYYPAPELIGRGGSSAEGGQAGAPARPTCADHPITPHSRWKVSASHEDTKYGSLVGRAIDEKTTRWSTGKPQSGDEWLQLDFGETVAVRRLILQQGGNENDFPRGYAVHVSDTSEDTSGPRVMMGVGVSAVSTPILLPEVELGRYVLIQQLGTAVSWWSVVEIEASCTDEP